MSNGTSSTNSSGAVKPAVPAAPAAPAAPAVLANPPAPASPAKKAKAPANNLSPIGMQGQLGGESARVDWVKKNTTVSDPQAAYNAVYGFTGFDSGDIREAQKKGEKGTTAAKQGAAIEDYIKKAPPWDNSKDLHRGMSLSTATVNDMVSQLKAGKKVDFDINNGGSASWSATYKVSESFAGTGWGKTPVIFRTKKMTGATPIMHLSHFFGENEVLSSKDNKFKAVKATKKKIHGVDGYIIDVVQI